MTTERETTMMNDRKEPCGECFLPASEVCDICGATGPSPKAALTPNPVDDSQTPDPAVNGDDDGPCTTCGGTCITYQTERRCACQPATHVNETPKSEHDAGNVLTPDPAAIREAKPRIIPMHSQSMYGVCIGGRWDGWVMVKHPDGYWVSHNKPDPVDPSIPDFAAKGAADDRA